MLTINNIYKSFYHRSILEDISFNVNQGDTIALLGRNGIAKVLNYGDLTAFEEAQLDGALDTLNSDISSGELFK